MPGAVRATALLEAQDDRALATIRGVVAEGAMRFAQETMDGPSPCPPS